MTGIKGKKWGSTLTNTFLHHVFYFLPIILKENALTARAENVEDLECIHKQPKTQA